MSGGGETGSLVMGTKPELFTAYLATSSQWDGDLNVLAQARTPVYFAIVWFGLLRPDLPCVA